MWVLFLGDVVGKPGRRAVREFLSRLRSRRDIDLVIANGENAAGGVGVTGPVVRDLFDAGVDVLTGGNHTWDKREGLPLVRDEEKILRPANYPPGVDGRGWGVFRGRSGTPYVVVSLVGRVFMGQYDCPFRWMDEALPDLKGHAASVIVDFHAEATSEKQALGIFLDGKVSAVVGTHTHVPTGDERLLPGGTAFLTDVGMTGPYEGVIGFRADRVLPRFLLQTPTSFEVAKRDVRLAAVMVDIDETTGGALGIERLLLADREE